MISSTVKTYSNESLKLKQFIDISIYCTSNPELNQVIRIYKNSVIGFLSYKDANYYESGYVEFNNITGTVTFVIADLVGWTSPVMNVGSIAYFD